MSVEEQELLDSLSFEEDEETEEEKALRKASEVVLDEHSRATVLMLVDKLMIACDQLSGHPLRAYQRPLARRIFESLILGDGARITALASRQCLDGDTVVFRRDGTAVRLRNHEDAWSTGVKPTKRYVIRGGGEIIATDNHPVMTPNGWVPAGLLREGDYVTAMSGWDGLKTGNDVIDREITIKAGREWQHVTRRVSEVIDIDIARIMGYFVTDGSDRPGQSAKFTNTRLEYLREFEDLMQRRFGISSKWYAKGNGYDLLITGSKNGKNNPFRDFLRALEWDHGFPVDVFNWSQERQVEFINRAWSGDGSVCVKARANGKSSPDVFLACGNDEVYARYWQALLLRLGVRSTVKREIMEKTAKGECFHRLTVAGGDARRLLETIGLVYGKEDGSVRCLAACAAPGVARGVDKPAPEGIDGECFRYSRIVRIEDAGEREVFDVEYDGKGWFVAQGIKVHNSGKSETIANVIATAMIFLPILAKAYPKLLRKYREGVWVGAFAPVNEQADIIYGRIVARLSSDSAKEFLKDPEINARVEGRGGSVYIKFLDNDAPLQDGKGHCLVRKTTCHPKAKIEGRTYHILLIDEAQDAHWQTVTKSVSPMGASVRATHIWTGTPSYTKGIFYNQIQTNKREVLKRGRKRPNHFQWDWKEVAKVVPEYRDAVYDEMRSLGSESDEFKMSYCLWWAIDKGQFTTSEKFEELGDVSVQRLEPAWFHSPVVVGIDCGKKQDRTVVTVVWVDWDHPDSFGFYEHRIINWLDLEGMDWEQQYFQIYEFLQNYKIYACGVDAGGVGDVVLSRLKSLMPHVNFVPCLDSPGEQSVRWKHLKQLMDRRRIIWPMGAKVRKLKTFQRFRTEMEDAELDYKGPNMMVYAPNAVGAHDDYVDSLAMALAMTVETGSDQAADKQVVIYENMLFAPRRRYH